MSAFFFQRINDHVQYLRKLEKTLKGEGDFRGVEHEVCKLGQWMHGDGRAEVTGLGDEAQQAFESMFATHEAFHVAGSRALAASEAGDQAGVQAAVTEMIKLSNSLIDVLGKLDRLGSLQA